MKITLDANPDDAPCCIKIIADDGRSRLIQTDWDYPSIASIFGWSIRDVQKAKRKGDFEWFADCGILKCKDCDSAFYPMEVDGGRCPECNGKCRKFTPCEHDGTDGTVICKQCKLTPADFIAAARQWIDDNDGAEAEDPGYFD